MDLLFKKYADPFSLLNGYISTSRFCEFIQGFVSCKIEDDRWEWYLHRVWDMSYDEFCETLQTSQDLQRMTDGDIAAIVKKSSEILGNFNPEEDGEEGDEFGFIQDTGDRIYSK